MKKKKINYRNRNKLKKDNINFKKILSIAIIFIFLINIFSTVFADDKLEDIKKNASAFENVFSGVTEGLQNLLGGPSWMHGLVSGLTSGFTTYNALSNKVKIEKEVDKVNISDNKDDFSIEDHYENIHVDFNISHDNPDIVLTDKNVLDTLYIETVDNLKEEYYKEDENPDFRVAEYTEEITASDWNNSSIQAQKRGILFDDSKESIKNTSEFRNLILRYKDIVFEEDPIKMTVHLDSFFEMLFTGSGMFTSEGYFDTFKNKMNKKLKGKVIEKSTTPPNPIIQTFHLLFNSKVPNEPGFVSDVLPDCRTLDGKPLGYTGTEYLPNIAYDWEFEEGTAETLKAGDLHRSNWCDVSQNGIYCDSTQFSIELLQKIKKINDIVDNYNDSFTCPPAYKEQDLVNDVNNIGITYLEANKQDDNTKLVVDYSIKGNYDVDPSILDEDLFDINTLIEYKNPNSFVWNTFTTSTESVSADYVVSGSLDQVFSLQYNINNISENAKIKITLSIQNINYEFIEELEQGDNSSDNQIVLELSGPGGCNLETSSLNIRDYCIGAGCQGEVSNLVKFESYLMLDGYSEDFQKDFDDLYRNEFLSPNQWYTDNLSDFYTPMYKYFSNTDKFNFITSMSDPTKDLVLSGPGIYSVKIDIDYDSDWKLFNESGEPTGSINIILDKVTGPEIDMPIYYMPIDGVVGISDQSRINYGVSYINDIIPIDDEYNGELEQYNLNTYPYSSSTPINTVNVNEIKDFKIMNNDNRGQILEIKTNNTHTNPTLKFAPSKATPLALRLNRENGDAYAFYKLSLGMPPGQGGSVAHPGSTLTYWTGFENCEDFTGVPSIESFLSRPDIVASHSELAPFTQSDTYSYGVEFPKDEIIRTGNLWLKTILYTPNNYETGTGQSYITFDSYKDHAKFYATNEPNGSETVELENIYGENITSLKNIYELIANKNACVDFDSTTFNVYYNPKKAIDVFKNQVTDDLVYGEDLSCIGYDPNNDGSQGQGNNEQK